MVAATIRGKISLSEIKKYLTLSCELALGGVLAHSQKNTLGPCVLLSGAYRAGDINKSIFSATLTALRKLAKQNELLILSATVDGPDTINVNSGAASTAIKTKHTPIAEDVSLQTEWTGKQVLLIDDQSESGWRQTLSSIFGANVLRTIPIQKGEWKNPKAMLKDEEIISKALNPDYLKQCDLILLDLYLIPDYDNARISHGAQQALEYSGLRLLEKIRKVDATIPIVLFTASGKAFNVKAAEEIGIDGYFPKEAHYHKKDELKDYYLAFKKLTLACCNWERRALRELTNSLIEYEGNEQLPKNLTSDHLLAAAAKAKTKEERAQLLIERQQTKERAARFKQTSVQLLRAALSSLSLYQKSRQKLQLIASSILLGNIIEIFSKDAGKDYTSSPAVIFNIMAGRVPGVSMTPPELGLIMAYQIRNSAAHSNAEIYFEDVCFSLLSVLSALGAPIGFDLATDAPKWEPTALAARRMVNSLCKYSCPGTGHLCTAASFFCDGSLDTHVLKRAMFLSMFLNLQTDTAKENQMFFKYLFYMICLDEISRPMPRAAYSLLKSRLSFECGDIKHPPFFNGTRLWVGVDQENGRIMSSLGCLPPDKYESIEAPTAKRTTMRFRPNTQYLRKH